MQTDISPFTSMSSDPQWEWISGGRDKPSINGDMVTTYWKMRRKVNGEWQYRELTPEEEEYWVEKMAW